MRSLRQCRRRVRGSRSSSATAAGSTTRSTRGCGRAMSRCASAIKARVKTQCRSSRPQASAICACGAKCTPTRSSARWRARSLAKVGATPARISSMRQMRRCSPHAWNALVPRLWPRPRALAKNLLIERLQSMLVRGMTPRMNEPHRPGVTMITGASGFIGSRLRDSLIDEGYDVVALTRAGSPEPKRGRAAAVDYSDVASLERVLERERPQLLFHVAGSTKGVTYDDFERGNVMPTRNLLAAARQVHPDLQRFVHISSLTAYGPSANDSPHL